MTIEQLAEHDAAYFAERDARVLREVERELALAVQRGAVTVHLQRQLDALTSRPQSGHALGAAGLGDQPS